MSELPTYLAVGRGDTDQVEYRSGGSCLGEGQVRWFMVQGTGMGKVAHGTRHEAQIRWLIVWGEGGKVAHGSPSSLANRIKDNSENITFPRATYLVAKYKSYTQL